jgi:putative membrane protein
MVQMGLLGALITFAGEPLYAPHLLTTAAWGLTPLEDQQLGGLIMWAPAAAVYLVAALLVAGRWLRDETRAAA